MGFPAISSYSKIGLGVYCSWQGQTEGAILIGEYYLTEAPLLFRQKQKQKSTPLPLTLREPSSKSHLIWQQILPVWHTLRR